MSILSISPPPSLPKWHTALVVTLLGIFFTINVLSLRHLSLTADEEKHYLYGSNILALNSDRFDDSKMPFSAWNALPQKLSGLLPGGAFRTFFQEFSIARFMTILFSMGVAYTVYHWTRTLYGNYAGLLALFLYTWDPNIIAHSMLVTTDIYATGMTLFSLVFFWKFLNGPNWKTGAVSALVLGVSQLAKYTCIFLYPLFLLMTLMFFSKKWIGVLRQKDYRELLRSLSKVSLYVLMFLLSSILVINIGFLFNKTFTPLQSYQFSSELFQSIQQKLAGVGGLPVPVPYPYVEGLDLVRFRERSGYGFGRIYLFGELHESEGFLGYYFFATLFKMPIATQIILLIAVVVYFKKFNLETFLQNEQFILLPALFFAIYFNFFYHAQIGIRFFILLFPLLYVFSGGLLRDGMENMVQQRLRKTETSEVSKRHVFRSETSFANESFTESSPKDFRSLSPIPAKYKIAGGVLALYLILSVLSYHPHYIPYFNELVLDRRFAYKYLADSNLDWEQADFYLDDYLAEHPNARVEPLRPRDGLTIVSVNALVGVTGERDQFAWLRDNFEPVEHIAYAYLVFKITPQELEAILSAP